MAEILLALAAGMAIVSLRDGAEDYYYARALPGERDDSDRTFAIDDGVPPGMQAKYRMYGPRKNFPVILKNTAPRPYPFQEPFSEHFRPTLEDPNFYRHYALNWVEGQSLPHPWLDSTRMQYPYNCMWQRMRFIGGRDDRNILASM